MTAENESRRMMAGILVKAILDWGGVGKDVAEYMGVSPTTISHWRGADSSAKRKPAIPSTDQLVKLLGILKHRVQENSRLLMQLSSLGAFDRKTEILMAKTVGPDLDMVAKSLEEVQDTSKDMEVIEQLEKIQKIGGPATLRSLLNVKATWGNTSPPKEEGINDPVDIEALKSSLEVDEDLVDRVNAEAEAYVEFFHRKIRKENLSGQKKGKK